MSRPTTFKPEYIEEVVTLAKKGYTVTAMCDEWDISRDTFYRWVKDNEDFAAAFERSKPKVQNAYEQLYFKIATGEIRGNIQGMNKLMAVKFADWRESKQDSQQVIQAGTVNILNNFSELPTEKLIENIKSKLLKNCIIDGLDKDVQSGIGEPSKLPSSSGDKEKV